MNVKVMSFIFSSLKITSDGGQGPGYNGKNATKMSPPPRVAWKERWTVSAKQNLFGSP
jgi:hypothetical protein